MADELGIITENDAGTSWVDLVPDEVSSGYQAQNTNIEANRNGIDLSHVRYDSGGDEIVIEPSGPIDDNGLPFSVDSQITFANPGAGTWYLRVIPGSTSLLRSIDIVSTQGTWDGSKNGLYDGNPYRILNWVIEGGSGTATVAKLLPFNFTVGNDLDVVDKITYNRRLITSDNYMHDGSTTQNDVFDKIAPFVPNTGDIMPINGGVNGDIISKVTRTSATVITFTGQLSGGGGNTTITATDGNGGVLTISATW